MSEAPTPPEGQPPPLSVVLCPRCGAENPKGKYYCGDCGAALEPEVARAKEFIDLAVSKAIASSLKDSKIVEIEIAERIWDRLWKWAKTFGVIMGILLTTFAGILGLFGYSNYRQVITAINEAQTNFQSQSKVLTDRLNALNQSIAEREGVVAGLDKRIPALEKRLTDYDLKLPDLANAVTLIAKLPEIQSQLNQSPEAQAKLESVRTIGWGEERELTPAAQQTIEAFLAPYRTFLKKCGFRTGVDRIPVTELIEPKSDFVALYSNGRLYLGSKLLGDQTAIFRLQTYAALRVSDSLGNEAEELFWGLANYFPASFIGQAYYENLPNHMAKFSSLSSLESFDDKIKLSAVWDGTFWDLRKSIGKDAVDALLCVSWTNFREVKSNDLLESVKSFAKKLLESDSALNRGANADKIRAVFQSRGIQLD